MVREKDRGKIYRKKKYSGEELGCEEKIQIKIQLEKRKTSSKKTGRKSKV